MKKFLISCSFSLLTLAGMSQSLLPQPVSLTKGQGSFALPASLLISAPEDAATRKSLGLFTKQLESATGIKSSYLPTTSALLGKMVVRMHSSHNLPKEGYRLKVNGEGIELVGSDEAGIFYGLQTLLQLLPKEIESSTAVSGVSWTIPAVTIEDHPRFGWRGLMLDVSRHFFSKEDVKTYIDNMSRYKFNLLHWHLTDDQGWRIEIKSLPKLTEVGAWRVDKTGRFNTFSNPEPNEPKTYGGFYTQEDIKEIIAYAKERQVDILPEIDVPGHSLAAIAAYPELTCTPGTYAVNSGEPFMVWPAGGHFYGLIDNSLCPANEKVYEFMDKVFTEVAQLFPFGYIHMGGDETARNFWEKSQAIKNLMKKEKLKNLDEVQSYFVKRMARSSRARARR